MRIGFEHAAAGGALGYRHHRALSARGRDAGAGSACDGGSEQAETASAGEFAAVTDAIVDRRAAVPGALWFAPGADLRRVASVICERAWRGLGVRVYRWPDGMVVLVSTDSRGDQLLMRHALDALLGTYCRAGALSGRVTGEGPQLFEVLDQLRWAAFDTPSPRGEEDAARVARGNRWPAGWPASTAGSPGGGSSLAGSDAGCTAAISR